MKIDVPDLLVLRHGETEWNKVDRMQGHLNSPLTDKGKTQALHQNTLLSALDLTDFKAWSSPQGRAFHTAALALNGVMDEITTDRRLVEITVGDWTGKTRESFSQFLPKTSGFLDYYDHIPGGEGFAKLRVRCKSFLESLNAPAVLITHGITSRMLRAVALGLGNESLSDLPGGQGVVHKISNGVQTILK